MFEELHYNSDYKPFRVLCISQPFQVCSLISADEFSTETVLYPHLRGPIIAPTPSSHAQGGTKAAPRREGESKDAFTHKESLAECRQFLKAAARDPSPLLKVHPRRHYSA